MDRLYIGTVSSRRPELRAGDLPTFRIRTIGDVTTPGHVSVCVRQREEHTDWATAPTHWRMWSMSGATENDALEDVKVHNHARASV